MAYPSRPGVREPEVARAIHLQVIEARKGLDEEIIEQDLLLEGVWINLHQRPRLVVSAAIRDDVQLPVVVHTAMRVDAGRVRDNLLQLVGIDIQKILPAMRAIIPTRWSPLHEEGLPGRGMKKGASWDWWANFCTCSIVALGPMMLKNLGS